MNERMKEENSKIKCKIAQHGKILKKFEIRFQAR